MSTADPISAAIIRSAFSSTAREVWARFIRTSLTPTIYELHDFSVAVFDDEPNLVADASGLPEYVGSLALTVSAVIERIGRDQLEPGDTVICSEPFTTGAHPPDIAVVSPAFHDGRLVGFCALRGHMGDVGGRNVYPADANSTYEEGIVLPPLKLYAQGRVDHGILAIIEANSRQPRETSGNLLSAALATRAGAERLSAVVDAHGEPSYRLAVRNLLDSSEQRVREVIAAIADGEYVARDVLDSPGLGHHAVPIVCTVRIKGTEMEVDVTGSAPVQGGAINVPFAQTVAACRLALKRLTTQDTVGANAGEYRPLRVSAPPGSIFDAQAPVGTFMMHVAASLLSELVVTAVMPSMPDRVPAPSAGHTTGFIAAYDTNGKYRVVEDAAPIGLGAFEGHDGTNALQHFAIAGISVASAEVLEAQGPVLKRRCELVTDSGGPGRWRGGLGTSVEWVFEVPAELTTQAQRIGDLPATGRGGGLDARGRNDVQLAVGTDRERSIGMATDVLVEVSERVIINGAGGGGYGDPFQRDPDDVLRDVLQGFVSSAAAESDYGVALDASGVAVDRARTETLRASREQA